MKPAAAQVALFLEHRRDHFQGPIGIDVKTLQPPLLDEFCQALAAKLRRDASGA